MRILNFETVLGYFIGVNFDLPFPLLFIEKKRVVPKNEGEEKKRVVQSRTQGRVCAYVNVCVEDEDNVIEHEKIGSYLLWR